MAILLKEFQ